jgi:trigger factor
MKVDIKKLPKSEIEMNIIVAPEEWREFYDEAVRELSADLKIEGFRPGHVPAKMVEEKIGTDHILEHAAEHCVRKCYVRAVMNNNIEAVGRPEISVTKIAKDNPFEFRVKVAVLPEVKLPDYKKIAGSFKKDLKEVSVSEEETKKAIDWLVKSRAKYITVPRACRIGDRIEIDFEGQCEGQILADLTSKNHPAILGRGYFMPSFEENILGMKEGEEKEFKISFPADFSHKPLAGKQVDFKTRMNLVQETEVSEFNDEFAKSVGDFKDASALQSSIKDGLLSEKKEQEKERWRAALIEKIAASSQMEIPEVLIEAETARILDDLKAKVAQIGLEYEKYLEKFNKTEEGLLKEFRQKAQQNVRNFLVLQEIAKQEKIEVTEEELNDEVSKALAHFEATKQAEQQIDKEQFSRYTSDILKNEKVFQSLENC